MRILVIGSGGREHALSWKLAQEAEVICAPGNPGMRSDVGTRLVDVNDPVAVVELARETGADLVVIGPEDPLIAGLGDQLRAAKFAVFGPGVEWARLEGSKAFSKALMRERGVPTARFETFEDPSQAEEYAWRVFGGGGQLAVKANGAALGKGVTVASNLEEAVDAIERMMVRREFGCAGDTVILEERLIGREFSLLTLVSDHNYVSLPMAQDHKRAFDGDEGPNTGGMGAYSPCDWVTSDLIAEAEARMVEPVFQAVRERGGIYRGTLFTGVMVTDRGPKCLEYNVRFGDPETQTIMARLGDGFAEALRLTAVGERLPAIQVQDNAAVTVVIASGGYPGVYRKGLPISLPTDLPTPHPTDRSGAKVFFAGVAGSPGSLVTSGGRVLGVTGIGPTLAEARASAYTAADQVRFEGAFCRSDIGASN